MEERYLHALESVPLDEIVKEEYRTYQIYTLMDRAIPYLQDGLKPGQRRILFTLWKNQSKGLMKVSSATGLVLTLHPHGPASVESAIVNMAQDYTFSNNYPLIDKKGYFGERMETAPAASRYIECKLGEVAKILLFDDMGQVEMIPNYDEKVMEPLGLLPKLPLMLLNGAEGIGTGFSSVIPSFHHKDIISSMIQMVETGSPKKLKPYVANYTLPIETDGKNRYLFNMGFEKVGDSIFITELPKGYDAQKIYRYLTKYMDEDYIKDFVDSSVDNDIRIELIFKRGQTPSLEEVKKTLGASSSLVPNYTLISERGVKIFDRPEEIISIFTKQRLEVVKRRYELWCKDLNDKITQNNEIIKFIKNKEYEVATKSKNRKSFVEYLDKKKYVYAEYLADMPIYRMTKEEVEKRLLMIKDDTKKLSEYEKIAKSQKLVEKKLIEELQEVGEKLSDWQKKRERERKELMKKMEKGQKKKKKSKS
ncbi:DNA gyrase/topoisomerase IV, A subunit [Bacteriovorax sp. BSW11_IV]|uniref:DNA gyrase subunit A n=1 Tax=Bacteriovorax sp. BSW11_IV TaxID=1353529 RepID=UPI00038A392A|nr:DNA gyrase subunit A [Bacteriovorax sp. BSW11_IV]EQC47785.1 DNA gyrase/topoisomerase IV, A subunit [Bacteriovorax sp. BSW11_IV]